MSFSFDSTAGASQSSVVAQLKGNDIHDVKFDGCEIKDFEGKKDPTKTFKTLALKFSNEDGVYEHTIFEPTKDGFGGKSDFERGTQKWKDRNTGVETESPTPSNVEMMMMLFKHAIDAINPTVAGKIDDGSMNLGAKDWNELRELVAKILNKGKGAETRIKLVQNNKGEARFPGFFVGLTRNENKPYMKNNFIGAKVAFTAYELTKIQNAATAKPTDMGDENLLMGGSEDTGLDLDFDL